MTCFEYLAPCGYRFLPHTPILNVGMFFFFSTICSYVWRKRSVCFCTLFLSHMNKKLKSQLFYTPYGIYKSQSIHFNLTPSIYVQHFFPLKVAGEISYQSFLSQHHQRQTEKFSYLILSRLRPAEEDTDGVDWARLIAPVLCRTRHVHCRMCCPDGQLQHKVVTARKHSR